MINKIEEIKERAKFAPLLIAKYGTDAKIQLSHNYMEDIAYLLSEYDRMRAALKKAESFMSAIMEFYGEGLMVYNWHLNGDGEPWDNFFNDNMNGDELETVQKALTPLSGCR